MSCREGMGSLPARIRNTASININRINSNTSNTSNNITTIVGITKRRSARASWVNYLILTEIHPRSISLHGIWVHVYG